MMSDMKKQPRIVEAQIFVPGLDEPITISTDDDIMINQALSQTGHVFLIVTYKSDPGRSISYWNCPFSITQVDSQLYTPA